MASRYWVGGTAAWDVTAGTKWALTSGGAGGQAIPTSADDVFFDASSGAITCTISTGNTGAKSIACTGFTGTLAGTAAISVSGGITLVAGMTYTYTGAITLLATGTLITAAKTLAAVTMTGAGATFSLGSALTSSGTVTLTSGTFTTTASNYAVIATIFAATGSSTKVVTLNASTLTLSSNGNAWNSSGTSLTINANTSTINLSGNGPTFVGNGFTYSTVSFTGTTANQGGAVTGANTFGTLNVTAPTTGIIYCLFTANQTITTLTCAGASAIRRILLGSDTIGTARTLTVGTYTTKTDVDFRDIVAAGASSPWSGTRLGNCGGNTSITFVAGKTVYWNLTGAVNWSATGWATASGGTPAVNNFPLAQDTAVFDNAGAATTVSMDSYWSVGTLDMSSRTSAMTFTPGSSSVDIFVYGNWVTGSGVTYSSGGISTTTFAGASAQTLTSAGKTFTQLLTVNAVSLTLQDAFTSSNTDNNNALVLSRGTLDAVTYNVTLSSGGFSSTGTLTRTLAMGSGTWTIGGTGTGDEWNTTTSTGLTITGTATISFTSASAKSFNSSGSVSYSGITINQGGAGALTISGANTFANISNTYNATGATTITFAANQTLSDFTATGTVGKVLTINSSNNGTARTLTKTSGTVSVDYMSIRDSTATGGATWYAGANSTSVSGNTGWIFTAPPTVTNNNFFFLF